MTVGSTLSVTLRAHVPFDEEWRERGPSLVRWKRDEALFFSVKNKGTHGTISISHRKVNWSVYLTE